MQRSTAASVTGTDNSAAPVSAITGNNNQLNFAIDGTTYNVSLATGTYQSKSSIANQINTAVGSNVASVVNNQVVLTTTSKGAGGSVQISAARPTRCSASRLEPRLVARRGRVRALRRP
jgi:hypothetical protein